MTLLLAASEFSPLWIVVVFLAFLAMVLVAFFLQFGSLYVKALLSGCYVGITRIVGMKLRGVNPGVIIDSLIMAHKAGLQVKDDLLESHYMARGNVPNVVRAIIAAEKAGIELIYDRACAIDLAGRDVLDAVRTSVNPRVIECPAQGRTIDAVAKDGIQVKARARVTVRASLDRLVGGATEETVIARVGEGIVSAIGSALSYKDVLENPDTISKAVLKRGLDAGTAFDILSIDIADVDVGENVGAKLEADQAEADVRVARAKAEERRAMAAADVVVNQVPQAMAAAFRAGNMGIMDYYTMKNVEADTKMRQSISEPPKPPPVDH